MNSKGAILYDATKDIVVKSWNGSEKINISGLEDIMTALLVIESREDLEESFKVSDKEGLARYQSLIDEDSLKPGEELSFRNALEYMLLTSAKEARDALQVEVAGSIEDFRRMMESKAHDLSMENTDYLGEASVSTSEDQLKLVCEAVQNQDLRNIVSKESGIIPSSKHRKEDYRFNNMNGVEGCPDDVYPIKRGYSSEGGADFAAIISKNDNMYLGILLGAESEEDLLEDVNALLKETEVPEVDLDYRDLISFDKGKRKKERDRLRKEFLGDHIETEIGEPLYEEPSPEEPVEEEIPDTIQPSVIEEKEPYIAPKVERAHPSGTIALEREEVLPAAAAIAIGAIAIGGLALKRILKKK